MQAENLASSKKRIKDIIEAKPTDRIGIFDKDIELYSQNHSKSSKEFFIYDFDGPFESLSKEMGLENALLFFEREPRRCFSYFRDRLLSIMEKYETLKESGTIFDGSWINENMAYDNGLYFLLSKYRNELLGFHKDICMFFLNQNLPLFFHCDGKIEDLIPLLDGIGIKAIHPVQERCNPHLLSIKKTFSGSITFIGGVAKERLRESKESLLEHVNALSNDGSYIFSFDSLIPENYYMKEHDDLIQDVEKIKRI